jgi:hypothetical protein
MHNSSRVDINRKKFLFMPLITYFTKIHSVVLDIKYGDEWTDTSCKEVVM